MKNLALIAVGLLCACATAYSRTTSMDADQRQVTAVGVFEDQDIPFAYRRIADQPGWKWVLWSSDRMCVVDSGKWIRTRLGDRVSCEWRTPR